MNCGENISCININVDIGVNENANAGINTNINEMCNVKFII